MTYLWPQRDLLISDFINPGVYTVLVLRFGWFYFFLMILQSLQPPIKALLFRYKAAKPPSIHFSLGVSALTYFER